MSRSSGLCLRLFGCSNGSVLSRVQASNPDCREALWRTQQASSIDELFSGEYWTWRRYPLICEDPPGQSNVTTYLRADETKWMYL